MAKVHFAEDPAQVDIFLRSGEKISTIIYINNPNNISQSELCEQYVEKLMDVLKRTSFGVKFGTMLVRISDISAISVTPYVGYGEMRCGK